MDQFKKSLAEFGSDLVLGENEVNAEIIMEKFNRLPDIAFNCVGGQNAASLVRTLRYECRVTCARLSDDSVGRVVKW
jgi:NADPH:quinone reductase-like Zn-dependent oxidoreductase